MSSEPAIKNFGFELIIKAISTQIPSHYHTTMGPVILNLDSSI